MRHPVSTTSSQATRSQRTGSVDSRNTRMRATRTLGGVVSLLIMLALKYHYSLASADQLTWILAPTAKMVAWLTPARPVFESGTGYVDFAQGIIVAPACAGINFMIMAFGLAMVCGLGGLYRAGDLLIWLPMSLWGAYVYTILINAVRIGLSMILYQADIYGQWLTAELVHRVVGTGLYLGALWLGFSALRCVVRRGLWRSSLPDWLPPVWYLAGVLGVPLARMIIQQRTTSAALGEHCVTILAAVGCAWGLIRMAKWLGNRFLSPARRCHDAHRCNTI